MHIYLRGDRLQRLRLASGLVLFAFAAAHFLNHALGLVSLEMMHHAQELRIAVTRSWPGTVLLLAALLTHISLALYKLARRKTWKMPRWEAVQIGLGLAIPFFLLPHIINTRIAHVFFGVNDSYLYELKRLWPDSGVIQSLLLLIVWGHGCLGLHHWLKLSDRYRRFAPALHAAAVAVPLLALAGFAVAGRATSDIMSDPEAFAALKVRSHWPNDADGVMLAWLRTGSRLVFTAVLASIAGVHLLRQPLRRFRRSRIRVTYAGGRTIDLEPSMTLLEASRRAGVPHPSVCGGRARCSTCRVKIEEGLESLQPPMGAEAITLKSIEAPPNIRLACQVRPSSSLTVSIVTPPATPGPVRADFVEIRDVVAAHVRASLAGELAISPLPIRALSPTGRSSRSNTQLRFRISPRRGSLLLEAGSTFSSTGPQWRSSIRATAASSVCLPYRAPTPTRSRCGDNATATTCSLGLKQALATSRLRTCPLWNSTSSRALCARLKTQPSFLFLTRANDAVP